MICNVWPVTCKVTVFLKLCSWAHVQRDLRLALQEGAAKHYKLQAASHKLKAASYRLQATSYKPQATS